MYNEALENINHYYFEWLYNIVEDSDRNYSDLLSYIFDKTYDDKHAKLIPNDDNRISDALELRVDFRKENLAREEEYLVEAFMHQEVSLLEILIALSYRMEDVMGIDRFPGWFWELLQNLGLEYYDNDHFSNRSIKKIDKILEDWCHRRYSEDGSGGLFPLFHPPSDQRETEIWYQMSSYLIERYM